MRPLLGAEALLVPFDPSTGNETHQGHCRAHWTVGRNRFSAMEAPVTHGVCDLSTARPIEVPSANATGGWPVCDYLAKWTEIEKYWRVSLLLSYVPGPRVSHRYCQSCAAAFAAGNWFTSIGRCSGSKNHG